MHHLVSGLWWHTNPWRYILTKTNAGCTKLGERHLNVSCPLITEILHRLREDIPLEPRRGDVRKPLYAVNKKSFVPLVARALKKNESDEAHSSLTTDDGKIRRKGCGRCWRRVEGILPTVKYCGAELERSGRRSR